MMSSDTLSWIVSYDIRDPARLRRMAKLMGKSGHRLQWSVFACDLDRAAVTALRAAIAATASVEEDDVRMYALNRDSAGAWLGPLPHGEGIDLFGYPAIDLVRRWQSAPWGRSK